MIHMVDPLIIYFPLYLALEDVCVHGIQHGDSIIDVYVEYKFASNDVNAIQECMTGAIKNIPNEYHIVLTSGDKVENENLSSLYPLITRAPIWGMVFGELSKACGTIDRNEFDECFRTRELHELEFEPNLIDQVDWFTYPEGTTTYTFCSRRLGIKKIRSSINGVNIHFGNEFEVLDEFFEESKPPLRPFGVLTIAPWNLPYKYRPRERRRQPVDQSVRASAQSLLRVVQMPRVFFPFTYLCIPNNYIERAEHFESDILCHLLNMVVFENFMGQVCMFYAADHSYLPNHRNVLSKDEEVERRLKEYSEKLGCSRAAIEKWPSLLIDRYAIDRMADFIDPLTADAALFGSPLFNVEDLKDAGGLIGKLRDAGDPLSQYLQQQFSAYLRKRLAAYNGSELPPQDLKEALIRELNQLLLGELIYGEAYFARVDLDEMTQELLAQNRQSVNLVRLNRLLLEDAYPQEIAEIPLFYPLGYTGNKLKLRRVLALYPIAKRIVDFYYKQAQLHEDSRYSSESVGEAENKWVTHLPYRLYECLTCLAKHEIFPADEARILKYERELEDKDVELYEKVRDQKALASRLEEQKKNVQAQLRVETAAGVIHNLRNLIAPALAPAQDAIVGLEKLSGTLEWPDDYKPTPEELDKFWSLLRKRNGRTKQTMMECVEKLRSSAVPSDFLTETLDGFYEYLRSDIPERLKTKTAKEISNQLLKILHATWGSPRPWLILDEKRPAGLMGVEHDSTWETRKVQLNNARHPADIQRSECLLWGRASDSGRLVFSMGDQAKDVFIVAGVIVQHILYELLWNGIKSSAEKCFLAAKPDEYCLNLDCWLSNKHAEWVYRQTPCEEQDAISVRKILSSPPNIGMETTFRGLRGVRHLADRLGAHINSEYAHETQTLEIKLQVRIADDEEGDL